jgi:hypothetical protein
LVKTSLKGSASIAKPTKTAKKASKGAVTESRTFRDGLIYLYQRADFKKPTWLCRVKIPNGPGYVNRSTGTGDEHQAFKFADDLYNQLAYWRGSASQTDGACNQVVHSAARGDAPQIIDPLQNSAVETDQTFP